MSSLGASQDGIVRHNNDQTHHAVAHMSAGINDMGFISLGHSYLDGNAADKRLSGASFQIGAMLYLDPSRLRTIGETISRNLCK